MAGKDIYGNEMTYDQTKTVVKFTTITVKSLVVSPTSATIAVNESTSFKAQAYDVHNKPISVADYNWNVNNNLGTVSPQESNTALFKANILVGESSIEVRAGGLTTSVKVKIVPGKLYQIDVVPGSAELSITEKCSFKALGFDRYGNHVDNVQYSWNAVGFIGTASPSSGTETIFSAGILTGSGFLNVTSGDVTAAVPIVIKPGPLESILVTPKSALIKADQSQLFNAVGFDCFNNIISISPAWDVERGTITDNGLFTPYPSQSRTYVIYANQSGITGNAEVIVILDTDNDGIPDSDDDDDDNDGFLDEWEEFLETDQKNALSKPKDSDGDGKPDGDLTNSQSWMDTDDDEDSIPDDRDDYPGDPDKWETQEKEALVDNKIWFILIIIIIIAIFTTVLTYIFLKRPRNAKPITDEEFLNDLKKAILHDEPIEELEYSIDEIEGALENQFRRGAISVGTYNFIKNNILSSKSPLQGNQDTNSYMITKK
jgi:hypothetical protein